MTNYFADTSALAKRYLVEVGSGWVSGWTDPGAGNAIIISALTSVEMSSLLARREREGFLSIHTRGLLQITFLTHAKNQYFPIPVEESVLKHARQFTGKHGLRTLDAIQLASAYYAASILNVPITFVSADQPLLAAAAAEGFLPHDLNAHP